jgi:hypothetical protein
MSNVIFSRSLSWTGRYRVQAKGEGASWLDPHGWQDDRIYDSKHAAVARAENLLHKRGIDEVRVIDTKEST